jgi:hypothetical protein
MHLTSSELNSIAQGGERVQITRWHLPDWGVALKTLRVIHPRNGLGDNEIYELVSFRRAPA